MIKYRTSAWGKNLIDVVEVERETENSVFLKGSRCSKTSSFQCYFDTWEEAKLYLLEKAEQKVESTRFQLEREKAHLGNIKGLKKPEGA